ncbi:hypothetical protein [Actinoalloteichus spitiensis]|uniref:hypothetical protein n=1 Tax=Actinoalloteichus spitiensis TaxID=252394 RepID=UPI000379805F|nr:hypothetical protein [Actinoalloteichus spitiensis]
MTETTTRPTETMVPTLPCVSVDETADFYQAIGFTITFRQTKPYVYLAMHWGGVEVHFGSAPPGTDPAREDAGGCLVMVDSVAPYHEAITQAMRRAYGKVLAKGRPRITRYRPGATRFTLVDPTGNSLIFIQRDEPEELEYGGSTKLTGLARVLDNVRNFREFKNDDQAAVRALRSWLRRHGDQAPPVERALALATLVELLVALESHEEAESTMATLRTIPLSEEERRRVEAELAHVANLNRWLDGDGPTSGPDTGKA